MSRKAYTLARSSTGSLGIAPDTILQNRQSSLIDPRRWMPSRKAVRWTSGAGERSGDLVHAHAEIVEPARQAVRRELEDRGQRADVVGAHGQDPPVEIPARHLDHVHVPPEHRHLGRLDAL